MSISNLTNSNIGSGVMSALGMGSGLNINNLVSQIVSAEGQPIMNGIQNQANTINTHISSLGTLKSALSSFQQVIQNVSSVNLFNGYAATPADQTVLTASADSTATAGNHTITVNQLATAQQSISSLGFSNPSSIVGTGTLTIASNNGKSFNVTIDSTNNSLSGIASAINSSAGNAGVTASIITVDNSTHTGVESHLVLTSTNTGTSNGFTLSGTDNDGNQTDNSGLSSLFSPNLITQTAAKDSNITVDGFSVTNASNTITGALQGVTLNLQSASVGKTTNLNVALDNTSITKAINNFVTAYNTFHSSAESLRAYGGVGGRSGDLIGDSTLNGLMVHIRGNISNLVSSMSQSSVSNTLSSIGISLDKTGTMSLDTNKLSAALGQNPQAVNDIFNSTDGIATRLNTTISNSLSVSGSINSRLTTYESDLTSLQDQQTAEQDRLTALQQSMLAQYTAMNNLVGQYQSIGSYLTNTYNKSSTG